jgi:hypothetical protein
MRLGRAGLAVAITALGCTASALADQTTHERIVVSGFAEAFFGCPGFVSPAGTTCRETHVQLYHEEGATNGGRLEPDTWHVFVEQYTLGFVSDDPDIPPIGPIDYATGTLAAPATMTFDEQHLDFASVDAAVAMSNGTTADLRIAWAPVTKREVDGNSGPYLAGSGAPRHFNDRCLTANTNAHQKLRFGSAGGTLDGASFHSYSDFPFAGWLQTAQYVFLSTDHRSCG